MASGDFNGDHKSDVAVLCTNGQVSLLLSKGDGTFQTQAINLGFSNNTSAISLVAGDFDGDGRTDLAIGTISGSSSFVTATGLTIVLFPGGAPSINNIPSQFEADGMTWADVDGDGIRDLLIYKNSHVSLGYLPGRRDGTFGTLVTIPDPGGCFFADADIVFGLGVGDLNGDGIPDIALSTCEARQAIVIYVLLGKGRGAFAAPNIVSLDYPIFGMLIGDFNGDAKLDLVFGGNLGMSTLLGNGDGTFRSIVQKSGFLGPFIAADFNGDGKPDLAQPASSGGVAILLSHGDGTFHPLNDTFPTLGTAFQLLSADFNGDGKPDIAALSQGLGSITILLNTTLSSGPHIAAGGVVGAGLSTPAVKALSPNAIASVFGDTFAPAGTVRTVVSADLVNGRLPTAVNNVCVYVNNVPAPIFFLSSNQINFQVPQIPTSGAVGVQVATSCATPNEIRSTPETVAVAATAPEFFYFKQSADVKNPIAAINAVNGTLIGPAGLIPGTNFVPAVPGDILTLFFTGGGATTPAFLPGELPAGGGNVTSSSGVRIADTQLSSIDILYAGVAPAFAGLYQLNIRIPAGVQTGYQPVVLTVGSSTSPAGYLQTGSGK